MHTMNCTRCHDPLTDENWTPSLRRIQRKVCRRCASNVSLAFYHRNPTKHLARAKVYLESLRTPVLEAYGNKCACCGESEPDFLTIDHVYNDGKAHRKAIGTGPAIYRWLRDRGYPKEGFQLLCFNCNCAKYQRGRCPHQARRDCTEVQI